MNLRERPRRRRRRRWRAPTRTRRALPPWALLGFGLLAVALAFVWSLSLEGLREREGEENPLWVEGVIVDAETGRPVEADVYLDGKLLYSHVRRFAVEVPSGSELRVEAPGYHPWALRFRYKLKEGSPARFSGPVRLTPVSKAATDEHEAKRVLDEK